MRTLGYKEVMKLMEKGEPIPHDTAITEAGLMVLHFRAVGLDPREVWHAIKAEKREGRKNLPIT